VFSDRIYLTISLSTHNGDGTPQTLLTSVESAAPLYETHGDQVNALILVQNLCVASTFKSVTTGEGSDFIVEEEIILWVGKVLFLLIAVKLC